MWRQSSLENIRGQMSAPPVHINVTGFHCKDGQNGQTGKKNQNLASSSVLSVLGGEMIKLSRLGTDLGEVCVDWGFIRPQML